MNKTCFFIGHRETGTEIMDPFAAGGAACKNSLQQESSSYNRRAAFVPMEAAHPISIPFNERKERTSPPRGMCALFVNRGEIHDEPP